jgi:hypothetical protein
MPRVRFGSILLKNFIFAIAQNFSEALMRSFENYRGGHMIDPFFNRQPS